MIETDGDIDKNEDRDGDGYVAIDIEDRWVTETAVELGIWD